MTTNDHDKDRAVLADRLVDSSVHALELLCVHLGLELGLYRGLDTGATEDEVARRSGVAPRYAREWLEQQTVSGLLTCDDPASPAAERVYRLPAGHAEVLLDADSPYHTAPIARMLAGVARALPLLPEAYRTGGGVPYHAYGDEIRRGIAGLNRPGFRHELADTWLAAVPDLGPRLRSGAPARALDLGCGEGVSTIALGQAFPRIQVLGVDLDADSVTAARAAAAAAGVADRVEFQVGDAAQLAQQGPFALVTILEALHDMGDPVGVLRQVRAALADDGVLFVADERVADEFDPAAGPVERLQYGFSVLHCLPATMAEQPVEAAGTALRAPTVARWAAQAGFTGFDRLPVEHDFWQFYCLRP